MNRFIVSIVALISGSFVFAGYSPEPWNIQARQKFAEQRFGVFIHWGLYANYAQRGLKVPDTRGMARLVGMVTEGRKGAGKRHR